MPPAEAKSNSSIRPERTAHASKGECSSDFLASLLQKIWHLVSCKTASPQSRDLPPGPLFRGKRRPDNNGLHHAFFEATCEPIAMVSENGLIRMANPAMEKFLSCHGEGLQGKDIASFFPWELQRATSHSLSTILEVVSRKQSSVRQQLICRRKDGDILPVDLSLTPFVGGGRCEIGVVMRDVSAQRKTERVLNEHRRASLLIKETAVRAGAALSVDEALRESLASFCRIADFPIGHIYSIERDNTRLRSRRIWNCEEPLCTREFRDITERGEECPKSGIIARVLDSGVPELASEDLWDPTSLRGSAADRARIRSVLAFPIVVGDETVGIAECMAFEEVTESSSLLLAAEQVGRILGELVERRRGQELLQRNEAFLRKALERCPVPLMLETEDDRACFVNQAFLTVFGYEENRPQSFSDWCELIFPQKEYRNIIFGEWFAAAHESNDSTCGQPLEVRGTCRDGSKRILELSLASVDDRTLVMMKDTTDQRRAEEVIQRAREDAVKASRVKSQFVATMSHELRTPLNGIIGMSELMRRTELTERQQRYLDASDKNAAALLGLVKNILDMSKIEAGKFDLEAVAFDVERLAEDVVESIAHQSFEKGLEVVCHVENSARRGVIGDCDRIRQVLLNLLSNAVKFTESGEVVVRVSAEHENEGRTILRWSVTDTGRGICGSCMNGLFEPFVQVDGANDQKCGTGLGLTISRMLVEAMGGEIRVESEEGAGSVFSFDVRVQPSTTRLEGRASERPVTNLGRCLLVTANWALEAQMREYLTSLGFECMVAKTGISAVHRLGESVGSAGEYTCVFWDESIDRSALRNGGAPGSARIVLLQRFDALTEEGTSCQSSFFASLMKPVKFNDLRSVVFRLNDVEPDARHSQRQKAVECLEHSVAHTRLTGNVLLAEDNEVNQLYVKELLEGAGLSCQVVCNGAEAVEAFEFGRFNIVLMDCQMPEVNGFDAAKRMRAIEVETGRRRTPILALTANAAGGDRERCLLVGMDDYLAKPFNARELLDFVHGRLRRPGDDDRQLLTVSDDRDFEELPAVDLPTIEENCMGNISFAKSLLTDFMGVGEDCLDRLRDGLENRDIQVVEESAHSLKGAAGIVCAESVREAAGRVEQCCRAGELNEAREWAAKLSEAMRDCICFIENELVEKGTVPAG